MMISPSLLISLQMNESDRKALIIVLIVVFILFLILGLIGMGIRWIIMKQSAYADEMMYDIVVTRVVNDPKTYRRVGFKKNNRLLLKNSFIPFLIILAGLICYLVSFGIRKCWDVNVFSEFGELFFQWDFEAEGVTTQVFGLTVLANWPPLKEGYPTFLLEHLGSYLACIFWLVGGVWYFIICQGYMARGITIITRSRTIFTRSLKDFKANQLDAAAFQNMPSLNEMNKKDGSANDPSPKS